MIRFRSPENLEYFKYLLNLVSRSKEKGSFKEQLGKYAPNSPYINCIRISFLTQQYLRSPIPKSLNLMSQGLIRYHKQPCESKICNFYITFDKETITLKIYQDILRL